MTSPASPIRPQGADCLLTVRISPKASRAALVGLHDNALKIAVSAPPEKGKANAAVIRLLARSLDVSPSRISLVGSPSSRTKTLRITGISPQELSRLLQPFL